MGGDGPPEARWNHALYDRSPDALLEVDGDGRVVAGNDLARAWFAVCFGVDAVRLEEAFAQADRAHVSALAAAGWAGAGDSVLGLAGGRRVSVTAAPGTTPGRFCLAARDVGTASLVEAASRQKVEHDAVAMLAGLVSAELNDPVSVVLGRLELLLELGVTDGEATRRHLEVALAHARRIGATMRGLRLVGREGGQGGTAYLSEVLQLVLEPVRSRGCEVALDLFPDDLAVGVEWEIATLLLSDLVRRALVGAGARSGLAVRGRRVEHDIVIRAAAGTSRAAASHVVQRGEVRVATAPTSLFALLAHFQGGRAREIESPHGWGVELVLPVPLDRLARARRGEEILLAVGGADLAATLEAAMDGAGFVVRSVDSAEDAIAVLQHDAAPVAGVVAAVLLDGMSGPSLVVEAVRVRPELAGRVALFNPTPLEDVASPVPILVPPLHRADVLAALGRRVRRSR